MEFEHLGIYSDIVAEANRHNLMFPSVSPGYQTAQTAREVLGFCEQPEIPLQVQIESTWEKDGLIGEELSWWVGYGPRTQAMFFPTHWARYGDWPDLAACQAPAPLLVQYDTDDELFTLPGMQAAHEKLTSHYKKAGTPSAYIGQFYPGSHKFDLEIREAAFRWLEEQLVYG